MFFSCFQVFDFIPVVLWMLRLTLFRDCNHVKSWAVESWLKERPKIPRYNNTLQVRNIFEYTLVQRPSNPVGSLKNGLRVGLGWNEVAGVWNELRNECFEIQLSHPKDHWTLHLKGLNLCRRGPGPQMASFEGSGNFGTGDTGFGSF